jgi:hypothetical protein
MRRFVLIALFMAGCALAVAGSRGDVGSTAQWIVMGAALLFGLTPVGRWSVDRIAGKLRGIPKRNHFKLALVVSLWAIVYLLVAAGIGGREFFPKWHDEQMLILQTRLLAHGRLWMPEHPLADFFEASYLFVKPVYAGIYFPGTALLYVPVIWLGLPLWIPPVLASGAAVGVLWLVVAEQMDAFAATLAALLLVSIGKFRFLSIMFMSHTPMLLLGLCGVWAYLQWRRDRRVIWALMIGAFSGWAAITRPVDAICYAAAVGLAMICDLVAAGNNRAITRSAICVIVGALPFLTLQVVDNYGITGHLFKTPYREYLDENSPETAYGGGDVTIAGPRTKLLQKLVYDRQFNQPDVLAESGGHRMSRWLNWKLPIIARGTTPTPLLLVLWPMGLAMAGKRRWVLPAMFAGFVVLYFPFPFMLGHYPVVASPGIIVGIALGIDAISESGWKWRERISSSAIFWVAASAIYAMAVSLPPPGDDPQLAGTVSYANNELPKEVKIPAVVLVRFREYNSPHQEIVYNTDTIWPDDAPIIKAQDLGPGRDGEIIRYYARIQPARNFYLVDRGLAELKAIPLGTARELAAKLPTLPTPLAEPIQVPPQEAWKTKLRND